MGNTRFYKLFGLILVAVLIVSSNIAVGISVSGQESVPSLGTAGGSMNHKGESLATQDAFNFTEFDWSPSSISALAEGGSSVEIIIGTNSTASSQVLSEIVGKAGGQITDTIKMDSASAMVVTVPVAIASGFVSQVRSSGASQYVEPNGRYYVDSTPNDQYYSLQWGLQKMSVDYAWNTTAGDDALLVAVIDTGIDYNHPDLIANYVPKGYDFVNNDNDPKDDVGHGTHCAGIIAASINNSIGVAGVAQVKIMAEKGLGINGGSYDALAKCIINATDAGADILSNSWGGYGYSQLVSDAVEYATAHGALVIAAAGNENTSQPMYPGAYEGVIAVAATNTTDTRASFSNFGSWVDISAPGVNIYSTMPTYNVDFNNDPRYLPMNYSYMSGTSMACPNAAGVAALIWSQYPTMTAEFVRQQLRIHM